MRPQALEVRAVGVPWQAREMTLGGAHATLRGEGRAQSELPTRRAVSVLSPEIEKITKELSEA
jgi:hypothetical protein